MCLVFCRWYLDSVNIGEQCTSFCPQGVQVLIGEKNLKKDNEKNRNNKNNYKCVIASVNLSPSSLKNILKKQIKFCPHPPSFWTRGKLNLHPHWKLLPIRGRGGKPGALPALDRGRPLTTVPKPSTAPEV